MQKDVKTRLVSGALAAAVCTTLTVVSLPPAGAASSRSFGPTSTRLAPNQKIGPVRNLSMAITKPSTYRVHARWDALVGATAYRVSLASTNGTVLASAKVTGTEWVTTPALGVGTRVGVKVVPLEGKRSGRAATVTELVPDLTAPTGSFTLIQVDRAVTVSQLALQDDLSAEGKIVRMIDWGDGGGLVPWSTGTTILHLYPTGKRAYHPVVRLTDEAGNWTVVPLAAVAIDDFEAPSGAFSLAPRTAWATYTPVTVTQVGELSDDVSAPQNVRRTVDWQDGTAPMDWVTGDSISHRYAAAGRFVPTVSLTDEANRVTVVALADVVVASDTVKPTATLTVPRLRTDAVRSWATLRGTARDRLGSGVRDVRIRVIEERAGSWFAYRAPSGTWTKAGTKSRAWRQSRAAVVSPVAETWSTPLRGLRKGVLAVRVSARDNVGNASAPVTTTQRLTRL